MKSRLGKLIAICLMAGVAAAFSIPVSAQDLPKTHLKVIGPHSKTATWKLNIRPFWEDELPSLSKGAITADLVSMTEMGLKGPEIFRLIKIGVADIGSTGTGYAAGEVPELDGFDLSGVVQDVATLRKVVAAYTPVIDKIMRERVGVRMLAVWPAVQQPIRRAVRAGVKTIEHGSEASQDVFALMRDRGVVLCPTLAAGDAIARYAGWQVGTPDPPPRVASTAMVRPAFASRGPRPFRRRGCCFVRVRGFAR